jgi:protein-L-isoaspartate(D-aspartate) O-methyltransferase
MITALRLSILAATLSFGLVSPPLVRAQPATVAPDYAALRSAMVEREIEGAGVTNPRVLAAMRATPRHEFMPASFRQYAYVDAALPIGDHQTISPPFIVAYMTQAIDPQPTDRVLEIGSGSGYQAAVLSPLVAEVYTIEIVPRLGRRAEQTLRRLNYTNVNVLVGDGYQGWAEHAPFDKIIVTCSPEKIPQPLVDQLKDGGQMIIPVGQRYQQTLIRLTKHGDKLEREPLEATLFVPMTGAAEEARQVKPDPLHPALSNGGFEQALGDSDEPAGWHYLRLAAAPKAADAPEGARFISFANKQRGVSSQVLQGFAIDGRQVSRLHVTCQIRGVDLAGDPTTSGSPALIISFYDERRAAIDDEQIGPWTGTFDWHEVGQDIAVPLAAREAIVALGLHGGTGALDVDNVSVAAVQGK